MPLDEVIAVRAERRKAAASQSRRLAEALGRHTCTICEAAGRHPCYFSGKPALTTHMRAAHGIRSTVEQFIGSSASCPICRKSFASRVRLLDHVGLTRKRGRRKISCYELLMAGAVPPVPEHELRAAQEAMHTQTLEAKQKGLSHRRSSCPPKRRAPNATVVPPLNCCKGVEYVEPGTAATNALDWAVLRPCKRHRTKTSLELLAVEQFAPSTRD